VDKYRDQYDLDDISETAWAGGTIDGTIYGIPAVGNTLHLAYRSDLFEEAGLEAPETYDDVIAICEALADNPDLDVVFTQDMSAGWAWELEFLHFVRAHGGDYLNEDSTPAFNSEAGVAALTQMKSVVDSCMGPAGLALGYEAAEVAINTGAQAMVHIWASNTVSMIDPEQSDFAELIFQILMEALDKESMEGAADVGIVTRTSISKGLPNLPAASETLASGIGAYSTNPATSLVQAALGNHLPFVGTGEMTPEEALAAAEEEYIAEATAQGYLE